MVPYIIIGAIILIIILLIGLVMRKRMFNQIDEYENWKVDIINRNIAAELARVKGLTLQGETKEKFENWKLEWENIITKELATVEEYLYDAENATERFQFSKARKYLNEIHLILTHVEEKLATIMEQLNELIGTEAENRSQVEMLKPEINQLRRKLSQDRFKYEHADMRFEDVFNELDNQLLLYESIVAEGNYAQAKELLSDLTVKFEETKEEFEEFPELYRLCKQGLPAELDELYRGLEEMRADGYPINHLNFVKEISDYQAHLIDCVISLETNNNNHDVKKVVSDISERVDEMYDLLEKEVIAKSYVHSKLPGYKLSLENIQVNFLNTRTEIDALQRTYHLEDDDLEKYMALEKMINQLKTQLNTLSNGLESNNQAFTKIREELEAGFEQLKEIEKEQKKFGESIRNLRKDELEAREQLDKIISEINQTHRRLRSSNIPGVPDYIWSLMDKASESNERVLDVLSSHPLDIVEVQRAISAAEGAVAHVTEQTNIMLEQAELTEHVIQYANRYRTTHPLLAGKLVESERLFRAAEYESSLELAASAIEEVEPGALKKIERFQEVAQ